MAGGIIEAETLADGIALASAGLLGIGGYAVASRDDELAATVRNTAGAAGTAAFDAAGAAAEATAQAAADEIKAIPGRAADAAQRAAEDAVEEIKAAPGKAADAAHRPPKCH